MITTWRLNVALAICLWLVLAGQAQSGGAASRGLVSQGDLSKEAADGEKDIPEGGFNIGGIEIKGGRDWGVRIGNWLWVRRGEKGGVDFDLKPPKPKTTSQPQGNNNDTEVMKPDRIN
ncbi:uncharacterized protein [Anabrus simplex]|uniref:uncharacterized protein n=1 Tax=Anabrus simplex TaxID=316456 RepID=UPI0034DD10D5